MTWSDFAGYGALIFFTYLCADALLVKYLNHKKAN